MTLYETAFENNFGPWELPQLENSWKWKCRFSSLGTSKGPKLFLKAVFYTKSCIITILNLFGAFCLKKWRFKKWISHRIWKMWFDQNRVTFLAQKNSEKAKHPKICICFGGSMPIAQIKRCHLPPRPPYLRCKLYKKIYKFFSMDQKMFYGCFFLTFFSSIYHFGMVFKVLWYFEPGLYFSTVKVWNLASRAIRKPAQKILPNSRFKILPLIENLEWPYIWGVVRSVVCSLFVRHRPSVRRSVGRSVGLSVGRLGDLRIGGSWGILVTFLTPW